MAHWRVGLVETTEMPVNLRRLFIGALGARHPMIEYTVGEIAQGLMDDHFLPDKDFLEKVMAVDGWLKSNGATDGEKVILYDGKW